MQSFGFKEWALVCAALGAGRQSVIIRKGGLAEGRDGFAFRHREFFLFPTFFHEQLARIRLSAAVLPQPSPNEIEIRYFARVEEARIMTNWTEVRELQPLHEKFHAARGQAMELLTRDRIDPAAIESLRAEQLRLADDASRRFTRALTDAAEVLTPEQRKDLAARFERRRRRWAHG